MHYHTQKGGLVLAWYDCATKKWGALGSRALVPSAISYEPKINSRKVQGKRTGAQLWQDSGTSEGGLVIIGDAKGVAIVDRK